MIKIDPDILKGYLLEDTGRGDITSEAVVPDVPCSAVIIAKAEGIISGLAEASFIFGFAGAEAVPVVEDGSPVTPGTKVMDVRGKAKAVLIAERTALNIIGRMSGIATKTSRISNMVSSVNPGVRIAGTRKTSPGARAIDKKAIIAGGGDPHRFDLSDAFLIKDNHLTLCPSAEAVRRARNFSAYKKIEVEAETPEEALEAAEAGADIIMLDNMDPATVAAALAIINTAGLREKICIEVSGGLSEVSVLSYAVLDIDLISMGSLTHSVENFDVSLDIDPAAREEN